MHAYGAVVVARSRNDVRRMIDPATAEELRQLFVGYFHQDWKAESGTPEGAIRAYAGGNPADSRALAVAGLTALVTSELSDPQIGAIVMDDYGSYYSPRFNGVSWRRFLETAIDILSGWDG